ncbi:MAG TPA: M48 family metalloprotease [Vicinamibacteria bacterium]|jgi:hypothetical protein
MTFHLVGGLVALAAFAVLSALVSLATALVWVAFRDRECDPERRARILINMRLLPTAIAAAAVLGLVVPAYARFEPRHAVESFGAGLPLLAAAAILLLARAAVRLARAWRATGRLESEWMRAAEPIDLAGAPLPAYRIAHPFPVVSVLGFARPRLFFAEQVLESLTPAELAAVLAHETAHVAARDNLKGLLMRSCPDWLSLTRVGGRLEQEWAAASEAAADDHARRARPDSALDLAAALLKVARLAPVGSHLVPATSALHDGGRVAGRVARLTAKLPDDAPARNVVPWTVTGLALVVLLSSQSPAVLQAVHRLSEGIVHLLG